MKNYKESRRFNAFRTAITGFIDLFYPPFRRWIPVRTFRYLACGGTVTLIGLVAYFFFYNFVLDTEIIRWGPLIITRYIAAYALSFCISFPTGFFLSKFVVFQESNLKGRIQLFRYGIMQGLNIFLNWSLLHLFVGFIGFWATPSQALTAVLLAFFSYFFQRNISFRVKKTEPALLLSEEEQGKV